MAVKRAALVLLGFIALGACSARQKPMAERVLVTPSRVVETSRGLDVAPGVIATMVMPAELDAREPIDLILYALPNGNSTEQTMGRQMTPGMDWHFDIQHIAAQTRALRAMGMRQAVVVYLEADSKSWPTWRRARGYDSANKEIGGIVGRIRAAVGANRGTVTLTGHSGGGSFMFGFIEGQAEIPDWIDRIAFLDAVYNFEAPQHGDKLAKWLRRDPAHTLVSVAYDDREIMLDGKKVVSDSGGTFRATERMLRYLRGQFAIRLDTLGEFLRNRTDQVEVLVHPNPGNRILHTEMIGEMNAYMHAVLLRRPGYDRDSGVLKTERAYTRWVSP